MKVGDLLALLYGNEIKNRVLEASSGGLADTTISVDSVKAF